MIEFLLELIKFNSEVPDYSIIIPLIIVYMCSLWLIVSVWVYFDAKKRYEKMWVAAGIAFLNFILQFPFLFVYLLVRPAGSDEDEAWIEGGVNVPIINFTGKDGVVMSLELRINPKTMADAKTPEMKIDVNFDSEDEHKQLINIENVQTGPEEKAIMVRKSGFTQTLSKLKSKLFTRKRKQEKKEEEPKNENGPVNDENKPTENESETANQEGDHKKKRKKKRRRR
jgi:hypothetical protein